MESEVEAIVMGVAVAFGIGGFSYGWSQISLWRLRSELIEVTAQVVRVQSDGGGGALVRVRYSLEAITPPSGAGRRPVLGRLRQPEAPGGPWVETTVSSILLQESGTDHVDLLMHPDKPRRVTGRPIVSLYAGIFSIVVASFLALAGWVYFSDLVR